MKLPYSEGSVFLVPLRRGGFARGVVARASEEGKAIFGYFFGPRLASKDQASLEGIRPRSAVKRIMFGDLGLINGEWSIIGAIPNWIRTEWPMPDFVRRDPLGRRRPILVRYCDADPTRVEAEYPIDDDSGLEVDSTSGYGAVEIILTKVLA
jgi:hypothetical protein